MHSSGSRTTRRRSSAGPQPAAPPRRLNAPPQTRSGASRPTYLTLRDHGKVYVADLPRLSDGQLSRVAKEAQGVLESLNRRLEELDQLTSLQPIEQETQIRASTKRSVTERFLQAIEDEQCDRRNNPALRAAAGSRWRGPSWKSPGIACREPHSTPCCRKPLPPVMPPCPGRPTRAARPAP